MKFLNLFLILSLLIMGISCSSNQVDEGLEDGEEISEGLEDGDGDDADFVVDADDDELMDDEGDEVQEVADSTEDVPAIAEEESVEDRNSQSTLGGVNGEYTVQEGDTLMYVAFKLFGDYKKWRQLRNQNSDVLRSGMPAGTVLRYSDTQFVWNHQGRPYLIKRGDTLGTISNDKYGTSSRWKSIWRNNEDMIQNPNLIFAGFTLYYIPGRDVASGL